MLPSEHLVLFDQIAVRFEAEDSRCWVTFALGDSLVS